MVSMLSKERVGESFTKFVPLSFVPSIGNFLRFQKDAKNRLSGYNSRKLCAARIFANSSYKQHDNNTHYERTHAHFVH